MCLIYWFIYLRLIFTFFLLFFKFDLIFKNYDSTFIIRCDKDETKYTGALVGLGCAENGIPILPDHDMEIIFDVKFDHEDLTAVC